MSPSSTARVPGRDRRAERWPGPRGAGRVPTPRSAVVVGGGIAGLAAAAALADRGVAVTVFERHDELGGRVRSWSVDGPQPHRTMSRGFHAFFRQYYNLRSLLRRADPALERLHPVADYPLHHADGQQDSFRGIPRTPPWNLVGFVARSPSFSLRDLTRIDLPTALGLLDVAFPETYRELDDVSAADYLDRLRFPDAARHLALEVFARSFFSDPEDFSAGELVAMFHAYFVGSAEGLLFDVPSDDYDRALWSPLRGHLERAGVTVHTGTAVTGLDLSAPDRVTVAAGAGGDRPALTVDAVVLATDLPGLATLLSGDVVGLDPDWSAQVRSLPVAPPFAVWRLWLDQPVDGPDFLGTSGYGPLDNVSLVHGFEAGAARWAHARSGSVVELHAYALGADQVRDEQGLRRSLAAGLRRVHPATATARVLHEEFLVGQDCPAHPPGLRSARPGVRTPDRRVVLAGDGIACDLPVALMERAATTGVQAANTLLESWGVQGHDLWSVPHRGRFGWPGVIRRRLAD